MVRRLRHGVGVCKCCGSSAVYKYSYLKDSKTKVWQVICCNPECGKRSSGFIDIKDALHDWRVNWDKTRIKDLIIDRYNP